MAEELAKGGTIVPEAKPADKSLIGQGPPEINKHRQKMFKRGVKNRDKYKKALKQVHSKVDGELKKAQVVGEELSSAVQNKAAQAARTGAKVAVRRAIEIMDSEVTVAMREAVEAQNAVLKNMGLPGLSPAQKQRILAEHTSMWVREEFPPGSGITARHRFGRHEQLIARKVENEVASSLGTGGVARIRSHVQEGLIGSGPGRTIVKGGSTFKQFSRFSNSEQFRKSRDVSVDVLEMAGLDLGRWSLSFMHKWYGGREICEVFASRIPDVTLTYLHRRGVQTAGLDLHGVYPLSMWPPYPHPNCMCHPVPYQVLDLQARKFDRTVPVEQVQEFPDDFVLSGEARRSKPSLVRNAYNDIAQGIGLADRISPAMVGTLGILGLGYLLTRRMRKQQDETALRTVQNQMNDSLTRYDDALRSTVESKAELAEQLEVNRQAIGALERALNKSQPLVTVGQNSKEAVLRQMAELGLTENDVTIQTHRGKWWMIIGASGIAKLLRTLED